jgi:hypothetical protein
MAKKYKLHCFGCGDLFHSKKDVHRRNGEPYCEECMGEWMANVAASEYDRFQEEEWCRDNPGKDPEEEHRKQVYLFKYGEY